MTTIGYKAFVGCISLERVELPKTVNETGRNAFLDGGNWFAGCSNVKEVVLEDGMEVIPKGAFANIPVGIKLKLPGSINELGEAAFEGSAITQILCKNRDLEGSEGVIYLPDSITVSGQYAFRNCKSLTMAEWPEKYCVCGT